MKPQSIKRERGLPVRIHAGCPFCERVYVITRGRFPQHTIDIGAIGAIRCDGSGLTPAEARLKQRVTRQESEPNEVMIATERQALMELIEVDSLFEGEMTISIPEYNELIESRQTTLKMLLGSNDPLLKEVAVAAMNPKRRWRRNKALLVRIEAWLRQASHGSTSET